MKHFARVVVIFYNKDRRLASSSHSRWVADSVVLALPRLVDMGFVLSIPTLNSLNGKFVDPLFGYQDCYLSVSLLEAP
jgi:hypothetical protein